MASFTCNSLTIVFLLPLCLTSQLSSYVHSKSEDDEAAEVQNPLIEDTCKKTQYVGVCMEAFESYPLSKDATNITQVSQIAISIMMNMASDSILKHKKAFFHDHNKCDFMECYTIIIKKLKLQLQMISKGKHNRAEIVTSLRFVHSQIRKVKNSLNSPNAEENENVTRKEIFLGLNQKFEQMCIDTNAICQSLPAQST